MDGREEKEEEGVNKRTVPGGNLSCPALAGSALLIHIPSLHFIKSTKNIQHEVRFSSCDFDTGYCRMHFCLYRWASPGRAQGQHRILSHELSCHGGQICPARSGTATCRFCCCRNSARRRPERLISPHSTASHLPLPGETSGDVSSLFRPHSAIAGGKMHCLTELKPSPILNKLFHAEKK